MGDRALRGGERGHRKMLTIFSSSRTNALIDVKRWEISWKAIEKTEWKEKLVKSTSTENASEKEASQACRI